MLGVAASLCVGAPLPGGSLSSRLPAFEEAKKTAEALGLTGQALATFILQAGSTTTRAGSTNAVEPALERAGFSEIQPVPAAHAGNAIGAAHEAGLERGDEKTSVVKFQDNTEENMLSPDFVNIDYFGQGYNIYFGNPLPTRAGVDPGYTDHAGEMIFELAYDQERTTGKNNGAYNIPDGVYALNDAGCKLSYTAEVLES